MDSPTQSDSAAAATDVDADKLNPWTIAWFGLLFGFGIVLWCVRTWPFIADDSYFYVVIARNIAVKGQQTFSNLFPTNGFHPLWGYLLAGYTFVVHAVWPDAVKHVAYAVPLVIAIVAGIGIQCWRLGRSLRLEPLVMTTLVVGFTLSLGMLYSEGPLFLLLLLTLLVMMARDPQVPVTRPLAFGLVTAAIVLVRLDAVFFVGFVYLYYLWQLKLNPRLILGGVLCGAIVGAYILSNIVFFGGAMPISGWLKGNFPHLFIRGFVSYKFPRLQLVNVGGYSVLLGWMPLVVGLATLIICRPMERTRRALLMLLWAGASVQGAYVALFTRSHTLWPWYYILPLALLAMSLGILVPHFRKYHARAILLTLISLSVMLAYWEKTRETHSPGFETIDFLTQRGIHGQTFLVSDWPGALAFYTDNNVIAADMLTSNRFDFEKMRSASNALDYLISETARLGHPIKYIIIMGNKWLMWDADTEKITYCDPRYYPNLKPIGSLQAHRTPTGDFQCGNGIELWLGPTNKGIDPGPSSHAGE